MVLDIKSRQIYTFCMITLEKPHVKYKESFLDFIRECQAYQHIPSTPMNSWWQSEAKRDIPKLATHFEDFVNDRLDTQNGSLAKYWENEFIQYWIIHREKPNDIGEFIGYLDIRPTLTSDFAKNCGGHIGVMVRPSAAGKAYPLMATHEALKLLQKMGLNKVLLTCNEANLPSRRVIEGLVKKFGGRFDDVRTMTYKGTTFNARRYWIER